MQYEHNPACGSTWRQGTDGAEAIGSTLGCSGKSGTQHRSRLLLAERKGNDTVPRKSAVQCAKHIHEHMGQAPAACPPGSKELTFAAFCWPAGCARAGCRAPQPGLHHLVQALPLGQRLPPQSLLSLCQARCCPHPAMKMHCMRRGSPRGITEQRLGRHSCSMLKAAAAFVKQLADRTQCLS